MSKLATGLNRIVVAVVVLAVVAGAGYYFFLRGSGDKSVTARFTSAVGIYTGTPVKILGVNVGTVSKVSPKGDYVAVTMTYSDTSKLPANAGAVEVANSLVSDRYIQLTPAYTSGTVLKDGATIPTKRTSAPAELDDIYAALNKLSVALGPKGANKGGQKSGALNALVNVAAANLKGNGAALGNSISKLSQAAATLSDNKGNLFQTVRNLQKFTKTLADSDTQIRLFNQQLASVAGNLADERTTLGAALHDLAVTLDNVSTFVKANASKFHTSVKGLEDITNLLVKDKSSLNETLAIAPVALANIVHAYQPNLGVLGTRSNLASLTDPNQLCALLYTVLNSPKNAAGNLLGQLTSTIESGCKTALTNLGSTNLLATIEKLLPQGTLDALTKALGPLGSILGPNSASARKLTPQSQSQSATPASIPAEPALTPQIVGGS